ncbi:hypothetical protein ScPMuIL_009027 [Solemya velum]
MPTLERVKNWGDKLSDMLSKIGWDATGVNTGYKNVEQSNIKLRELKGDILVKQIAVNLNKMLGGKMRSVQRLVVAAEEAAANYSWNAKLQSKDVSYMNAKERSDVDPEVRYNIKFKQAINYTVSSVHIPVEIYKGDIEILNGLQWTSALDDIFYKNWQADENILWQYFGSQTGFMRTFPASYWDTADSVDLYDVRRRPWYTQGSSSPKDMLILIDTSGSVHGQALQLIKVAVKSLMDTLGENDFIRIAHFSKEFHIVGCFKTFVQANYRNKKKLYKDVDALEAKGMADYVVGFENAFQEFSKFNESDPRGKGADCNKMIMLLTDGGSETAKPVFEKYNWPNKTVRVFTYAVGQTSNPTGGIRWMACANRGYFSQIPAMGAIRAKVQAYTKAITDVKEYIQMQDHLWHAGNDPRVKTTLH